jgi:hypothetical protein
MILKGNQRGGGRQLARHLLNAEDNEHVHVHDLRGFVSNDLAAALHEAYALSRSARARQYLFSLSLNPPPEAQISTTDFERAIEAIEQKLGLAHQPRAIVFHEKHGRRHAHAVWSRIDMTRMTAIHLPYYKLKLRDLSKSLYAAHDWHAPPGLSNSAGRKPTNFTHAEGQQAQRAGHDPKALKAVFQECWASTSTGPAFEEVLQQHGLILARGDRRGFVAVDAQGEVFAIARFTGQPAKAVKERLGAMDNLPSVEQAKAQLAAQPEVTPAPRPNNQQQQQRMPLMRQRSQIVRWQRREREQLAKRQQQRRTLEIQARAQRLRTGLRGLWDRITGRHAHVCELNARETEQARIRDQIEADQLIFAQIEARRVLHRKIMKDETLPEL